MDGETAMVEKMLVTQAFFKEMENYYGKRRKRINISGYRETKQNEWKA